MKTGIHRKVDLNRDPAVGPFLAEGTEVYLRGKKRCRMRGGALESGAAKGNKNALKHGLYTREAIERRRVLRQLMRQAEGLFEGIT